MSEKGWEWQRDRTRGREDCKSCYPRSWFHTSTSISGSNPVVYAERKCSSSLVLFLLVVVAILSSVKKTPLTQDGTKAPLSVSASQWGRVCVRTKKEQKREGGQWKRTAGGDDSALFYMDVSHLFFSSLFPPLWPSLSNILCPPPPPVLVKSERKKPLPSFCSFFSSPWPPAREKKKREKPPKESWNEH